ncbi:MAG: RNA polymerase sigma factor [Candidatus Kapabacteria bacterium]|nr:RNA polymerase sigma factor [Candidatus Kapabacteria bacterium]
MQHEASDIAHDQSARKQERFLALLKPHHDSLARFARAMTKTPDDARDLVSDTIEQAYKNFHALNNDAAFLSWLFTIASRIEKRRRWRERLFERFDPLLHDTDDIAAMHSGAPNAEIHYDTGLLYEALQRLPHKQREAFTLFEISGFSLQEIQELQGDSLSAVKMRVVRAREALRTMLGDTSQERATIHHLTTAPERGGITVLKKHP